MVASGETRSGIARLERRNSLGDGRIATDQIRSAADSARRVEHGDEDSRDIVARDLAARQALTESDPARTGVVGESAGTYHRRIEAARTYRIVGAALRAQVHAEGVITSRARGSPPCC